MKKVIASLFLLINLNAFAQKGIDIQHIIDTFITNNKIPAMAVSIIKLDTTINVVSGVHKNVGGSPIHLKSKFHLGSNTKAITSFIAAKLVEEGKMRWEDKVMDILPDLKKTMHPMFHMITLEQLLSHTAGIKAYTNPNEFANLSSFEGSIQEQRQQAMAYTLRHDTLLTVGKYAYSNMGYVIASLMLEAVAHKTWEEQVRSILENNTTLDVYFGFPNREKQDNVWGHWLGGNTELQAVPPTVDYDISVIAPAGDISMNIVDYSKFIQLHLKGICGIDNFLKSETYNKLHFGIEKYALGWGNGKTPSGLVSTHNGSAGNFYCHTMLFKEKKIAIVVIANASSPTVNDAVIRLRRLLFNMYNTENQ